jgi:multicomponent Na+:H+ antiporter subunit D
VLAALAFLTVGISLKLALFPLHQWLPNAYAYAPSAVSAFLAATATKVSVYALLRFYFSVFGETAIFQRLPMEDLMLRPGAGRHVRRLDGGDLPARPEAAVRLLQRRPDRLHRPGHLLRLGDGLTATIVHLVNHARHQGRLFLLLGGVMLAWAASRSRACTASAQTSCR